MQSILSVLLAITALFFILLAAKELLPKKLRKQFCVICASISLAWITLLFLSFKGLFNNPLIIALLLGQTIVGIFYLVEGKVKNKLKVFRLPFLLSLLVVGYSFFGMPDESIQTLLFLLILWVIFAFVYSYQQNRKIKKIVRKLVACCKRW